MITASLGVSAIRANATPAASVEQQKNELLRAADTALYKARSTARTAVGQREVPEMAKVD